MTVVALSIVLICTGIESADNRVRVGVASIDPAIYGEMVSLLTKSGTLQVIERRDLTPLIREIELSQSGVVDGKSESLLKGIDYLVMMEKIGNRFSARIVRSDTGQILVSWTGTINELAENCISKLESDVALKNLSQMDNDKGIDVEINFARDFYPAGSKIEFTVEASENGFMYVIDVQPDGNVYVLVPNANTGPIEIAAGEVVEIPGRLGFRMTAGEPFGIDTVKVIVTKKKIDIFRFSLNMGKDYTEVKDKERENLSRGVILELKKIPDSDWGIGSKQIEIRKIK